jgi:hypothetical protein
MTEFFFKPEYITMWTAFGAIAQSVASIMAIGALIYSMTTFRKSLETSHYTELDKMYFDLLKVALKKPHLVAIPAMRSDAERIEYDVYAYMVWNFLETIYDRCSHDKKLCATWYPVIIAEDRLHRKWFDDPANRHKFKTAFYEFVQSGNFKC